MKKSPQNNFWIVYADLMAGLLFVFILLVAAVIVHYAMAQRSLQAASEREQASSEELLKNSALIKSLNEQIASLQSQLESEQDASAQATSKLANALKAYKAQSALLQGANEQLNAANSRLLALESELAAKVSERGAMEGALEAKNLQIVSLISAQNDAQSRAKFYAQELAKSEQNLAAANENLAAANENLAAATATISALKSSFSSVKTAKTELAKKLAKSLQNRFEIDPISGSVRLKNSVLFDSGSFELKAASKQKLAAMLKEYFAALSSDEILSNIDAIVIEGHTDSDGGYLYNLELSQKRSLEILKFIYAQNLPKQIISLLSAVGKSYSQPVLDRAGKEDKAASRRIEIKLIFNNQAAINQYEKRINDINFN